jgi:hypothetical protein
MGVLAQDASQRIATAASTEKQPELSQNRPARSSLVTDGKTLSMEAPR